MKRSFLSIALLLIIGGIVRLSANEAFPMGWWGARCPSSLVDLVDVLDSSYVRIFIASWGTEIIDDLQTHPSLQTNLWTPYRNTSSNGDYIGGGYLSVPYDLIENYPPQWDYDSLAFWKDLAYQLGDELKDAVSDMKAVTFFTSLLDFHTQQGRRRLRPALRHMVEALDHPTVKSFLYGYLFYYLDRDYLADTLDNWDGKGLDVVTGLFGADRTADHKRPDDPNFDNDDQEEFQAWLDGRVESVDRTCTGARAHRMEFWPEIPFNGKNNPGPGERRRLAQTELRVITNLCLLYGSKGFTFYYFSGFGGCTGEGVVDTVDTDGDPYMSEEQRDEVFGAESGIGFNHADTIYYNVHVVAKKLAEVGPTFRKLEHRDGISIKEGYAENYFYIDRIDAEIEGVDPSEIYFEVGIFSDPVEGKKYFMIVNRMCRPADEADYTIKLKLPPGTYDVREMYTGWWAGMGLQTDEDGIIECSHTLAPGHAGLFRVDPTAPQTYTELQVNYNQATAYCNGRKIAVDKRGRIHICYTDLISGEYSVWYAYSDDGGAHWIRQRIGIATNDTRFPTLAVDSCGISYIAYIPSNFDLSLWSEGKSETFPLGFMLNPNHQPTLALDPIRDIGIVYCEVFDRLVGIPFKLSTLEKTIDHPVLGSARTNGPSCCFSHSEDAICITRELHSDDLVQMVNEDPVNENNVFFETYSGDHWKPNLSRQGEKLWATFIDGSDIKRRMAPQHSPCLPEDRYKFGDASTIIPNANAITLQMANDWPVLVMQKKDGANYKIYYSFSGDGGNWATLHPLTSSGENVQEMYPHVFIDQWRQTAYVMYTESTPTATVVKVVSGLSGGGGEDPVEGEVQVTVPAGGETWTGGRSKTIEWKTSEGLNPTSFTIYFKEVDSTTWRIVEGAQSLPGGNDTEWSYTWPHVGKDNDGEYIEETSSCNIMVVANTGSGQVSDVSLPFTIKILWDELPDSPGIASCGGSGTGIPSSGDDPGQPEPLGYLPPNEEEAIPWEGQGFYSFDTTILEFSSNQGDTFTLTSGGLPSDSAILDTSFSDTDTTCLWYYFGTIDWTIPSEPTSSGYLRLMGIDTTYDTVYSNVVGPFKIPPPGGFQYNTYSNQNIMSLNDNGNKIGLVYTAQDPDTATKLSVVYMESLEGLGFSAPDTIGGGRWPSFSRGACLWQNAYDSTIYHPDTLFYAYQLNDTFATPYPLSVIPLWADSGKFAPVGFVSENDTVHAIIRVKIADHYLDEFSNKVPIYSLLNLYDKFPEALPGACMIDTLQLMTSTSAAGYNIGNYAASVVKRDSVVYGAYDDTVECYFAIIGPSGNTTTTIGQGSQPSVSCSEGNLTYTYLAKGDTSLIRLWRYLDDTTWVERDTFYLDDDAEILCGEEGLMYGVQRGDTSLADLYIYEILGEEFYLHETYHGYYPHPYIADESNELHWITAYTDRAGYETYYLTTDRRGLSVLLPALYLESDDKRSPYTIFRDTCIHYASVDVDSAADSLIYRFPHLDSRNDYSVIVEFYTECDSTTQLQNQVGSTVDTIQIAANSYSWYETDISSGSDTLNLAIKRISQFGFVPVSRIIVWRPNEAESNIMGEGGPQSAGPVQIPFCLYQPFPNPFSSAATIRYSLPYATHVSLKIYDVAGRLVTKLVDGEVEPGVHELRWAGKDDVNRRCASGVYFVRFQAADYQASKKMVLIK